MSLVRVAVLASGSGSNFEALMQARHRYQATIELLITNNPQAYVLERAKAYQVDAIYLPAKNYHQSLKETLAKYRIDLIVLAGYLKQIPQDIVDEYVIINVHPSLLPAYGGKGFYGLKVHEAVLEAKETKSGATVHYVDQHLDTGPIICQQALQIHPNETPQSLQQRVLKLEHELLPAALEELTRTWKGKILKTALISVFDKTGVVELSRELIALGYQIISTGGTYDLLKQQQIEVKEVSEITQFEEILSGRVKTLHPKVHGGILYKREDGEHKKLIEELDIPSIDIVVNNLYPFESMLQQNQSEAIMIENIDIGGPSMIRAAAKNCNDVLVVVDPNDYQEVVQKLKNHENTITYRKGMAGKAFSYTAYYDGLIAHYFNQLNQVTFPEYYVRPLKLNDTLRYGENPHQQASYYEDGFINKEYKFDLNQLHGKQISFNNLNDLTGTLRNLKEFTRPTVVAIKHTNPSGIGSANTIDEAYDKAYACDEISIFGGIIALNRTCTAYIAKKINELFIEIIVAPEYEEDALVLLKEKKNIRILQSQNLNQVQFPTTKTMEVVNGVLLQEADTTLYQELSVVSKRQPSDQQLQDILFGLKASKNISSNGVVLVKNEATLGYGFGEVRRSWAVEKAIQRAESKAKDAILASDGFFFEDTIELLHQNGIDVAVSPGGSIHDQKVIDLANQYNMVLVFTKTRHFKH